MKVCCRKGCSERATTAYRYKNKDGLIKVSYLCDDHPKTRGTYLVGNICPMWMYGFVERFRHVDRGKCFRCDGKGVLNGKVITMRETG